MSYYIQLLTNRAAINAGMHGYGTHQPLKILEDDELFSYKTKTAKVTTVIYRFIDGHIKRAAGYSPWDKYGPCYEVDNRRLIDYKGSFSECKAFHNSFLEEHILKRLTNTSEAWTNALFKKLSYKQKYTSSVLEEIDYSRFIAMTVEMKKLSEARGAKFIFLYDNFKSCDLANKNSLGRFNLINDLENLGVNTVATSAIYSGDNCAERELLIPHDGHPAARANLLTARFLHENNFL